MEAEAAQASGLSQNEVCRRFSLERKQWGIHLRECCGVRRRGSTSEERRLADIARKKLAGKFDDAIAAAEELKRRAAEKGNQILEYRMGKEIRLMLDRQAQQLGAPKPEITLPKNGQGYQGSYRVGDTVLFPEDTDPLIVARYGGRITGKSERQRAVEATRPMISFRVEWIEQIILNPFCFHNPVLVDFDEPSRGFREGASAQEVEICKAFESELAEIGIRCVDEQLPN